MTLLILYTTMAEGETAEKSTPHSTQHGEHSSTKRSYYMVHTATLLSSNYTLLPAKHK